MLDSLFFSRSACCTTYPDYPFLNLWYVLSTAIPSVWDELDWHSLWPKIKLVKPQETLPSL